MIQTNWAPATGRELDTTPLPPGRPPKIVACLNVWNDLAALKQTVPSWIKCVDRLVVVYGPYDTTEPEPSDGTIDYFRQFPNATIIDGTGLTQCEKRTRYFQEGAEGEYLFIIDADETVTYPEALRTPMDFDVGWVRVRSPLYAREYGQPRIIRWMPNLEYRGRHHWMYHGEHLLCTHQYGGPGYSHRPMNLIIHNQRRLRRDADRMAAKRNHQAVQLEVERPQIAFAPYSTRSDEQLGGREALQIVHHAYRDDGIAPSRLHTAINRTTPHSSLFFKRRPGPFDVPTQFMAQDNSAVLARAVASCDLVHFHGAMGLAKHYMRRAWCVFHHHGSLFRANAEEYMQEAVKRDALILLSNLELLTYADGKGHFLPNTVPVARYRALRNLSPAYDGMTPFRVAHSPSQPHRKGTEHFLRICESLKSRGVPIEPVLIHDQPHRQALAMKATCHAAFDSFWLGMQCSGIEAAAMGLPVIAGDVTVRDRYVEYYGQCPYTFAVDADQLETELLTIVSDDVYREHETRRVFEYIVMHHDEAAVTLRYLNLLDEKFGWRSRRSGVLQQRRPMVAGRRQ